MVGIEYMCPYAKKDFNLKIFSSRIIDVGVDPLNRNQQAGKLLVTTKFLYMENQCPPPYCFATVVGVVKADPLPKSPSGGALNNNVISLYGKSVFSSALFLQ